MGVSPPDAAEKLMLTILVCLLIALVLAAIGIGAVYGLFIAAMRALAWIAE